MTGKTRIDLIKERLTEALNPQELSIIDESHLHSEHPGAQESGGGHFNIRVVSDIFEQQSQVERHKLIYMALGDIMGTEIHALSIDALTSNEINFAVMDHVVMPEHNNTNTTSSYSNTESKPELSDKTINDNFSD